jgi:hypothetical protein
MLPALNRENRGQKGQLKFNWWILGLLAVIFSGGSPTIYAANECQYLLKAQIYHNSIPLEATRLMENLRGGMLLDLALSERKRFYPLYIPSKTLQESAAFLKSLQAKVPPTANYPLRYGVLLNSLSLTQNEFTSLMALWLRDEREIVVAGSFRDTMNAIYKIYLIQNFAKIIQERETLEPLDLDFKRALTTLETTIDFPLEDWRKTINPAQMAVFVSLTPEELLALSRPIDLQKPEQAEQIFQKVILTYAINAAEEFRLNTIYRPQFRDQILQQQPEVQAFLSTWEIKFFDILAKTFAP